MTERGSGPSSGTGSAGRADPVRHQIGGDGNRCPGAQASRRRRLRGHTRLRCARRSTAPDIYRSATVTREVYTVKGLSDRAIRAVQWSIGAGRCPAWCLARPSTTTTPGSCPPPTSVAAAGPGQQHRAGADGGCACRRHRRRRSESSRCAADAAEEERDGQVGSSRRPAGCADAAEEERDGCSQPVWDLVEESPHMTADLVGHLLVCEIGQAPVIDTNRRAARTGGCVPRVRTTRTGRPHRACAERHAQWPCHRAHEPVSLAAQR